MNESAIRVDASLTELIAHIERVLSCPESSCIPERHLNRLHCASGRARSLLEELRNLLSRMGRQLNICEIALPDAEHLKHNSNWTSACRQFTQADSIRFIRELLGLLRAAKGLGAAIEITSQDIIEHIESIDDQCPLDVATQGPEEDLMPICQDSGEEGDLSARVEELLSTVNEELDWLREVDADLREVNNSLNAKYRHLEVTK